MEKYKMMFQKETMGEHNSDAKLTEEISTYATMQIVMSDLISKHGIVDMLIAIDLIKCGPLPVVVQSSRNLIQELHSLDTRNRNPKKSHINLLSRSMRDGYWVISNQGIGVCIDGFIIDGGNRIRANIEAGYPTIPMLLVLGLPAESQKYVDTNIAKRSVADTLKLVLDVNTSSLVVATVNMLLKCESNFVVSTFALDEIANYLEEHHDAIEKVISVQKAKNLPAPVIAGCVYAIMKNRDNEVKVLEFVHKLVTGEMLKNGDPELAFRNWLLSVRGSSGGASIQIERFLKTLSAVNACLCNKKLSRIYKSNITNSKNLFTKGGRP